MELTLIRKYKKTAYTIGRLYIGTRYFCDTLEDRDRGLAQGMGEQRVKAGKVKGQTAVPTGRYRVQMTFSNRFGRPLPQLMAVPGFSGIRIHAGNTAKDTDGCILVGRNKAVGMVLNSRETLTELINELNSGTGETWITIQ